MHTHTHTHTLGGAGGAREHQEPVKKCDALRVAVHVVFG